MKGYNENHVSRSTQMTPKDAEKKENRAEVQTQLESIRKTDDPQPRIDHGDKVRVIVKKSSRNATCHIGATKSTP